MNLYYLYLSAGIAVNCCKQVGGSTVILGKNMQKCKSGVRGLHVDYLPVKPAYHGNA